MDREFDPQEAEFIANIVKHHNADRGQHSFDRGQSKDVASKICIHAAVYGKCYREDDIKHSRMFSHDKTDVEELAGKIYSRLYERNSGRKPTPIVIKSNAKVHLMETQDTRSKVSKGDEVAQSRGKKNP